MRATLKRFIAASAFAAFAPSLVHAHAIAGRFFIGTLTSTINLLHYKNILEIGSDARFGPNLLYAGDISHLC